MAGVWNDVQKFLEEHEICGDSDREATAPTPTSKGYEISIRCPCGKTFSRWVTPEDAAHDLIFTNLLCLPD